jgi:hypothetical protein
MADGTMPRHSCRHLVRLSSSHRPQTVDGEIFACGAVLRDKVNANVADLAL